MRQLPRLLRSRASGRAAQDGDAPRGEPRVEMVEAAGLRWYHAEAPQAADTEWLAGQFGFHPLDLEDVTSINQRPKLDVYDDYLFLVPNKYAFDFLLIAAPTGVDILYDELPLDDVLSCEHELIGELTLGEDEPVEFSAIRCQLSYPMPGDPGLQDDGVHSLRSAGGIRPMLS